ncbi:ArnT family glycosyltransferase [Fonticella tunisiensis]|nr:glycosyltransferase family 39 protein [Fonticella tunisiensis]
MDRLRKDFYNRLLDIIERLYYFFLIGILLLAIYNLFFCLKETPIYSWDEARHGISAYEMIKRRDFIVNTYGYRNDYWNLKPPLSFWAIALGYKIAGFNPLGLRIFSAVAAFFTILISVLFVKYRHGRLASLITAIVLITSPKYIVIHSARTGDADSLFVLFFSMSMISMILSEKNIKWLYLAGFSFSMAFLTKSWHALNIVIIGLIHLVYSRTLFRLKVKEWTLLICSAFAPIISWASIRYTRDGFTFLKLMITYDLLTRSATTIEGHIGDHWYYFDTLKSFYSIWLWVLGIGVVGYMILYSKLIYKDRFNASRKNYVLLMILWSSIPLITFTKAGTKIGWYILPIYPAIAISIGGLCGEVMRGARRSTLLQIVLLLFIIKGAIIYQTEIYKHIIIFKNDKNRVTFEYFEPGRDIRGSRMYMDYGPYAKINVGPLSEFKNWQQSDMLSAELYWDIVPEDGKMDAFLRDGSREALIMVPKIQYFKDIIMDEGLKIVGESSSVYILSK